MLDREIRRTHNAGDYTNMPRLKNAWIIEILQDIELYSYSNDLEGFGAGVRALRAGFTVELLKPVERKYDGQTAGNTCNSA